MTEFDWGSLALQEMAVAQRSVQSIVSMLSGTKCRGQWVCPWDNGQHSFSRSRESNIVLSSTKHFAFFKKCVSRWGITREVDIPFHLNHLYKRWVPWSYHLKAVFAIVYWPILCSSSPTWGTAFCQYLGLKFFYSKFHNLGPWREIYRQTKCRVRHCKQHFIKPREQNSDFQ